MEFLYSGSYCPHTVLAQLLPDNSSMDPIWVCNPGYYVEINQLVPKDWHIETAYFGRTRRRILKKKPTPGISCPKGFLSPPFRSKRLPPIPTTHPKVNHTCSTRTWPPQDLKEKEGSAGMSNRCIVVQALYGREHSIWSYNKVIKVTGTPVTHLTSGEKWRLGQTQPRMSSSRMNHEIEVILSKFRRWILHGHYE